jgi:hypothetical protein
MRFWRDFLDVNEIRGPGGDLIGFTRGDLPLFPTYDFNQSYFLFGEGQPLTLTGKRGLVLGPNDFGIPLFTWGDIIPHHESLMEN